MDRYPRVKSINPSKGTVCDICHKNNADKKAEIQINIFRGDDENFYFHEKCLPDLNVSLSQRILVAREKFIQDLIKKHGIK